MSGIRRDGGRHGVGPGGDITTYTVDQLKHQMGRRTVVIEQLYGEIERRAKFWDQYGDKDMTGTIEQRARYWDEYGDPKIDKRSL